MMDAAPMARSVSTKARTLTAVPKISVALLASGSGAGNRYVYAESSIVKSAEPDENLPEPWFVALTAWMKAEKARMVAMSMSNVVVAVVQMPREA
jgi:hypothetical protein